VIFDDAEDLQTKYDEGDLGGGGGGGGTESVGGITSTVTATDDFRLGTALCEDAAGVDAPCLYYNVATGTLTLNRPQDGSPARMEIVSGQAAGDSQELACEATDNGQACIYVQAPDQLVEPVQLVARSLLWDSDVDAPGWGATENDVVLGGSTLNDTTHLRRIEIEIDGVRFTTAQVGPPAPSILYGYVLDPAGTALTGGNYYYESALRHSNILGAAWEVGKNEGFFSFGLPRVSTSTNVGNYLSGTVTLWMPAIAGASYRATWDLLHREGGTSSAARIVRVEGSVDYSAASSGNPTGIMLQTYSPTDYLDMSAARVRIYGWE
jgi:hypothetical protein